MEITAKIEISAAKEGRMRAIRGQRYLGLIFLAAIFLAAGALRADLLTTTPGGTVFVGSGSLMTDKATLSGGTNPTGTITFTLFDPANTLVDTETVSVFGNGDYNTLVGYAPVVAGTYEWTASYSGDGSNDPFTSRIGEEPESVSAVPEPSSLALICVAVALVGFHCRREKIGAGLHRH